MEQLSANGVSVSQSGAVVESKKPPAVTAGAKKPSVTKVRAKQPSKPKVTKKKSSNPAPNLRAVKTLLSGCPVTVSLSQPVTETPQEASQVPSSQRSHHDEFLGWLDNWRGYLPSSVAKQGSVEVMDDSATLTAASEDDIIDM